MAQNKTTFPKSIGASIDLLYTMRTQRLLEQKKIEDMQLKESALKDHIMSNFAKADLDGAKGKVATASIKRSVQADITDWEAYLKWCVKKGAYSCVQKRAGITALREHWDNKEHVPGVEQMVVDDLSLTKV